MGTKVRVLCIEDNPVIHSLMRRILEQNGFGFVGAREGREGLDQARAHKPDLILLESGTSRVDGWDVYRQIKADDELCDIPVIMVLPYAQQVDRDLGPDGYIAKPFYPSELLSKIYAVLG